MLGVGLILLRENNCHVLSTYVHVFIKTSVKSISGLCYTMFIMCFSLPYYQNGMQMK